MFKVFKAGVLVCVLSAAVMAGDMNGPTYTAPPPSSMTGDVNGPPYAASPSSGSSSVTTLVVVDLILAVLNIG